MTKLTTIDQQCCHRTIISLPVPSMMTSLSAEQAMTIVGTIGGFAISLSLVPQVYLTYKTKCADDISYTYQFIYIFGTALVNAYAIYFELYAVYIPCLLEFCLIVTLTVMKVVYPPRQDLLDCSKHSLMLSNRSDGNVAAFNLQILQHMLHHDEEVAADGEFGSKEFDKNMLRKSISLLKHFAVEKGHHHDVHEVATEIDKSNVTAATDIGKSNVTTATKKDESNLDETIHTGNHHQEFDV